MTFFHIFYYIFCHFSKKCDRLIKNFRIFSIKEAKSNHSCFTQIIPSLNPLLTAISHPFCTIIDMAGTQQKDYVTISCGYIFGTPYANQDIREMINLADQKLYLSKKRKNIECRHHPKKQVIRSVYICNLPKRIIRHSRIRAICRNQTRTRCIKLD